MDEKNSYIISYDLAGEGNYNTLIDQIKSYGPWAHVTESTWVVVSCKKATEIRDELRSLLTEGSRLMVVKSANVAAWSNTLCSNGWLKDNI